MVKFLQTIMYEIAEIQNIKEMCVRMCVRACVCVCVQFLEERTK